MNSATLEELDLMEMEDFIKDCFLSLGKTMLLNGELEPGTLPGYYIKCTESARKLVEHYKNHKKDVKE